MGLRTSWLARDVLDGMRARPGRILLAFGAIAAGVSALVGVTAVLEGLGDQARRMSSELGADVVAVLAPAEPGRRPGRRLEERHAALLARNLPDHLVSTVRRWEVPVHGAGRTLTVVATDPTLQRVRGWRLLDGRFLDEGDLERRERHAVVSLAASGLAGVRVGGVVRLRDVPFRVVGIVDAGGAVDPEAAAGVALGDRVVFVPRTVTPTWSAGDVAPGTGVDAVFLRAPPSAGAAGTVARGVALLDPPEVRVDGLSWVTPETLVRGIERLRRTLQLTVGAIAAFCLVLGGTTLMSLMIASVRERVAEIGLRSALGASPADVVAMFVVEGFTVSAAAAVTGSAGTHLALAMGRGLLPVPLGLGWASATIPLAAALSLGLAFSWWPARQAARIEPCEALRDG